MTAKTPWALTVATYNVLADAYVRPERYPRCDPQDFLPANRHPRLTAYAAALDADVLLCQEVDYATFERLSGRLRNAGYVGRWAQKWSAKPDGCATFVRAPLKVATWMILDLHDEASSGHVALAAVIKAGHEAVTVVNAHLKWDAPDAAPDKRHGLAQANHLLQVLENQPHAIVGGDFNAEPDGEIMTLFRGAGFIDPHPSTAATFIADGRPRKIDYLLHTSDLSARPHPTKVLTPATALPSASEPSDHLPLAAAFAPRD